MNHAVEDAITQLYAVFQSRRSISWLTPMMERDEMLLDQRLRRTPLRDLTPDDVTMLLLNGCADVASARYVLPRALEIAAQERLGADMPLIAQVLARTHLHTWPEAERAALRRYADALMQANTHPAWVLEPLRACVGL